MFVIKTEHVILLLAFCRYMMVNKLLIDYSKYINIRYNFWMGCLTELN